MGWVGVQRVGKRGEALVGWVGRVRCGVGIYESVGDASTITDVYKVESWRESAMMDPVGRRYF